MGTNISLTEATLKRAEEYQRPRKLNRSALIQYALERLFLTEEPDPKREQNLERAIKRWLSISWNAPVQVTYTFLYTLATRYPNQSAFDFWSEAVYVGPRRATHKELLAEIRRDFETLNSV